MNLIDVLVLTVASLTVAGPGVGAIDLKASVDEGTRWIIGVRQRLHQKPELGMQEFETSSTLRLHMDQMRIPYKYASFSSASQVNPCATLRHVCCKKRPGSKA